MSVSGVAVSGADDGPAIAPEEGGRGEAQTRCRAVVVAVAVAGIEIRGESGAARGRGGVAVEQETLAGTGRRTALFAAGFCCGGSDASVRPRSGDCCALLAGCREGVVAVDIAARRGGVARDRAEGGP